MFWTLVYPSHPDEIYSNEWPESGYRTRDIQFVDDLAKDKYASVRTIGTKRGRCRGQNKWTRRLQTRSETCVYVVSFLEQS